MSRGRPSLRDVTTAGAQIYRKPDGTMAREIQIEDWIFSHKQDHVEIWVEGDLLMTVAPFEFNKLHCDIIRATWFNGLSRGAISGRRTLQNDIKKLLDIKEA